MRITLTVQINLGIINIFFVFSPFLCLILSLLCANPLVSYHFIPVEKDLVLDCPSDPLPSDSPPIYFTAATPTAACSGRRHVLVHVPGILSQEIILAHSLSSLRSLLKYFSFPVKISLSTPCKLPDTPHTQHLPSLLLLFLLSTSIA